MNKSQRNASIKPSGSVSNADALKKQTRKRELEVLTGEFKSLKPGSRVYKQQPNSHIFFKEDMEKVFSEAKREMDELIQEYKEIENPPREEECGEDQEEWD